MDYKQWNIIIICLQILYNCFTTSFFTELKETFLNKGFQPYYMHKILDHYFTWGDITVEANSPFQSTNFTLETNK